MILRPGDLVRIVDPRRVVRVGYPKCLDDYAKVIEREYGDRIAEILLEVGAPKSGAVFTSKFGSSLTMKIGPFAKAYRRIIAELAHEAAIADRFGGKERSLHLEHVDNIYGEVGAIESLRTVRTGTYFPPGGDGEDTYPGGLSNQETHRLALMRWITWSGTTCQLVGPKHDLWFPATHLEKLTGEYQEPVDWREIQEKTIPINRGRTVSAP